MIITATEFKTNFGKYLELLNNDNIFITKNGKVIAQLTQPQTDRLALLESLVGIAKTDKEVTLDDIRSERLARQ